ncbi:hypothetical protein QYE80_11985 [Pseudomonas tohonis]|nr:hypothetical protein [Pseudomonas tohonis]
MITTEQILTPELLNALRNYRECCERYEQSGSERDGADQKVWALEVASELDCILEALGAAA